MKYLVFSDSHGTSNAMTDILKHTRCDGVFFLGDGIRDAENAEMYAPDINICKVKGNNDWFCSEPEERVITICNKKIFLCHGHTADVRNGTDILKARALKNGCDAALYGHTHTAVCKKEDGLLILNPGSVSFSGTYAEIIICNDKITAEILFLK